MFCVYNYVAYLILSNNKHFTLCLNDNMLLDGGYISWLVKCFECSNHYHMYINTKHEADYIQQLTSNLQTYFPA